MVVTRARACVMLRLHVFECVSMMTRMFCSTSFVLCMPVCSAADTLVVAAGFRYNSSVHFAAAVFAHKTKIVSCTCFPSNLQ